MEDQGMLSNVKKVIHSLVVSTPLRMTVEALSRDYKSEEGCAVPFRQFGFKDIESFLHSIKDTVLVFGSGPMAEVIAKRTEKTAHIQNLVKCQKKPSARNRRGHKPRYAYPSERSDLVFVNEQRNTRGHYNNNYNNRNGYRQQTAPRNNSYGQNQAPVSDKATNSITNSFAKFNIANVDEESSSDELNNFEMYLPDKQSKAQSSSPIQLDDNAKKPIAKCPADSVSSGEGSAEDATPANALNYKYNKQTNGTNLAKSKPTIVPKKEPVIQYVSSNDGSDREAIPAHAVDDRVLSVEYPKDAVRANQQLPARDINKIIKLDSRIQVQLVTVASPHSFYFWLHDEQYDDYKAMSINMQRFYDNLQSKRYTMPKYLIVPGHLAACKSLIWQRVRVLNIKAGSKKNIEVEYIDTGERMWVSHSDLKYLSKEFARLPAQCWYGRLSCVMPRQGIHFSMEASNYFYDLVCYRRLFAKIEAINQNNVVHMILVDPDAVSYTKNINIALIESGWVRRCYKP